MDYRTLRSALNRKALADEDDSGDHIVFNARMSGRNQRITKMSHGAKGQISKGRLAEFARQMRLSSRQLNLFVDCTLSRNEWLEIWESNPRQT